ncbi:MAG: 3-hydroxyacyl-ACP dehydratase [Armatimonadetes bacterium CG_4_10_14_0_8_um_filter_66_14]|nr:MAG: 3-hydroxyacyl-ACP dehydratase [Armatimonadetes bacterium CG_4_10_14_0_8_um_filter_66_14]
MSPNRAAGIDIGSRTTKLVVLGTGEPVVREARDTSHDPLSVCAALLEGRHPEALVATGYGRHLFAEHYDCQVVTEIKALARGASALVPGCRTLLDIGGQDMKTGALGDQGQVLRFEMNDRCAAGTGRFLEVMATALHCRYDDLWREALTAAEPVTVNSTCAVFAESEVVGLIARGANRPAVAAGIHHAVAKRATAMLKRVSLVPPVVFAGGVATNGCLVRLLQASLDTAVIVPDEPRFAVALGAALLAKG